jgi:predicted N-acetyltransferase YhbS
MSRVIRKYHSRDLEACLGIYRANFEAGLIPDHYEDDFLEVLNSTEILTLVLIDDGKVLGCGSISCSWQGSTLSANLSYGLIHPDHHRKKLGSYLLVSRLSLLAESRAGGVVSLIAIKGSVGFYSDVVGFTEYDQTKDEFGNRFHELYLKVGRRSHQDAIDYMAASGFEMDPALRVPMTSQDSVGLWSWD